MTKEDIMSLLYDYCRWESIDQIKELFKDYPNEIDLTDDDGMLFRMAVAYRSPELVSTLLDFYKETRITGNKDSDKYKLAEIQLKHMLQDAAGAHDLTSEIQKIIEPYLAEEEDSEDDQDLSGFEDIIGLDDWDQVCLLNKRPCDSSFSNPIPSSKTSKLLHSSSESLLSSKDKWHYETALFGRVQVRANLDGIILFS